MLAEMDNDINQPDTQGRMDTITASDGNVSIGTQTGESISQKPPVTNSNLPGLEGLERLVVSSDRSIRSFIPFGSDGTLVIISPFGEVLRMSKYIAEESPRVICLNSPELSRVHLKGLGAIIQERAQGRKSGLSIRLLTESKAKHPPETQLEWINGRWPCIHYEIDGVLVSVLFTVNEGVLSQQFFFENPSSESKAVRFALQIENATVQTLRIANGRWAPSDEFDITLDDAPLRPNASGQYNIVERELERSPDEPPQQGFDAVTNAVKGEALIAVFHNNKLLDLESTASVRIPYFTPVSDDDDSDDSDDDTQSKSDQTVPSASPGVLQIASGGIQKLVVQYKLQSHGSEEVQSPKCLDVETFLSREKSRSWSFKDDHEFNSIFRRYLEHVLCVCLVNVTPDSGEEHRIAFMNDVTLEFASTPLADFYIFRYLLFMYQLLKIDDFISAPLMSQSRDKDASIFEKAELQARIKEACTGHLRWCFEESVFLAPQSWPTSPKTENNTDGPDTKPSAKFLIGSLQMLKLFEFSRVFKGEGDLVKKYLQKGTNLWLDALDTERDEKSRLWYKDTRETYIAWGGRRGEGSDWLQLPDYRLGDLIYTWKALKSLETMLFESKDNTNDSPDTLKRLEDLKLRAHDVRKTILQCFTYQPQDALSTNKSNAVDFSNQRDLEQIIAKNKPALVSFAIAVRRSRERDRRLFYAKDAMLHNGIEWGFFKNDIEIEAYSAKNEPTKVFVQVSWQNTMQAQGIDHETTWKKPLRYALAITMANHNISLDDSKSPEKLAKLSWDKLAGCVMPHGLFPDELDRDTKLPHSMRYSHNLDKQHSPWATWEVATLMLGRRFRILELQILKDAPLPVLREESISEDEDKHTKRRSVERGTVTSPPLDGGISEKMRSALIKKVILEKRRTSSLKKVDLKQVSDPKERRAKEWLYSYPEFIIKRPPYGPMEKEYDGMDHRLCIDLENRLSDSHRRNFRSILVRGFDKWNQEKRFTILNYTAAIVDVGHQKRSNPYIDGFDAEDLDIRLRQPRSIHNAKKRFHYHAPLEVEHALILYLATPSRERTHMAHFYIRHSSYSSHLHEDIHPLANVWTTELHLSFFQLAKMEERSGTSYIQKDPRSEEKHDEEVRSDDVCDSHQRAFPQIIKGSKRALLKKASLSYRFVGDLDDKFWTGYLLTHLPGGSELFPKTDWTGSSDIKEWFHEDRRTDQRKVLEPFLVEKVVAELFQSTDEILKAIDDWLTPEVDATEDGKGMTQPKVSKADDRFVDVQYNRSATCLDLDATLRILRRLSKANVDSLGQWAKREESRSFQPRWSEKDEFKFRELIDFQKRRAGQQISRVNDQYRRIQDSIEQVRTHRQELINNINLAESRTAAHESENIRIFTYATVIFYPLSFVASLFSMQGPPDHTTTPLFLQATAIALVITLLMVFNAEILAWPIRRLRYIISHSAREKMGRTPNRFPVTWGKTLDHIKDAEEHDILHDHEMPKWPRSKLVYSLFLVVYFFVDFPASRIVLAYESVTDVEAIFPDNAALVIVRILVALIFLPVFAASWTILVVWSLLHLALTKVLKVLLHKWKRLQENSTSKYYEDLKKQYEAEAEAKAEMEAKEKAKEQDGEKDGDREVPRGEKSNKREKSKTVDERIDETRRAKRKEKDDRIRQHVRLLVNPPELLERMETKALRLRKRKKREDEDDATSSRISRPASPTELPPTDNMTVSATQNHASIRRSLRHLIFGRPGRGTDDEKVVKGRDK